jgi:hypothetical protein
VPQDIRAVVNDAGQKGRRSHGIHIAIQEKLDGKPVDWLEHVTPEQYDGPSGGS